MHELKKILIIRLSSIGDIVLTTPLIRCLKTQVLDCEVHYLIKRKYKSVIENNPYIDKVHCFDKNISDIIRELQDEKFDHIIDLHKNLRSLILRRKLKIPATSFSKLNFKKWLSVRFGFNYLPKIHIVDRYLNAVRSFGVENDGQGLDYFIKKADRVSDLPTKFKAGYIGIVIGGMHTTKMLPEDKVIELVNALNKPIILLGGSEDFLRGERIKEAAGGTVFNACGKYSLNQSAFLVSKADKIVSNDTGLMHIAAAFKKEIFSVWGNTIPEFGMYPYLPEKIIDKSHIIQVDLACRPCSKIGHNKCPEIHFNCMRKIDISEMAIVINSN